MKFPVKLRHLPNHLYILLNFLYYSNLFITCFELFFHLMFDIKSSSKIVVFIPVTKTNKEPLIFNEQLKISLYFRK